MSTITTCRSCHKGNLTKVLSLGHTPLANSLLSEKQLAEPETTFPLELCFCSDCALVQITETVPPEQLFRNYAYFSSFSDTMLKHAKSIAHRLITERKLGPNSLVVEIASNDGYLLQYYTKAKVPVLGIEPALNIATVARSRGIDTISEFFGKELATELSKQGKRANIIHANNVLAHVPDLNGVAQGMSELLTDDGIGVIEAPYLKDMLDNIEFDTIYHEHLCYFSLTALNNLFARHGLKVVDVERLEIHGGSLRTFVSKQGSPSAAVIDLLAKEHGWQLDKVSSLLDFQDRVHDLKAKLNQLLKDLKSCGKSIAAYGAAAKGSTLLNYFNIGQEIIDFVVDRSTAKQGLYMPGKHLYIHPVDKLLESMPDYVLLLSWNFADEIMSQQAEYLRRGGQFIVPLPIPKVVSGSSPVVMH